MKEAGFNQNRTLILRLKYKTFFMKWDIPILYIPFQRCFYVGYVLFLEFMLLL